jgi:hypothetical protein
MRTYIGIILIIIASISLWLTTYRMRKKFRQQYGRKPTDHELTSITAWMKPSQNETKNETPFDPQR